MKKLFISLLLILTSLAGFGQTYKVVRAKTLLPLPVAARGNDTLNISGKIKINSLLFPNVDGTAAQSLLTDGADSLYWGTIPVLNNIADDAANSLLLGNAGTAGNIDLTAQGSDANVGFNFVPKGTGQILIPDGTSVLPSLALASSPTTGMFLDGSVLTIKTGSGGGDLAFQSWTGIIRPQSSNTFDLGSSGFLWKRGFFAQDVAIGNLNLVGNTISSTDTNGNINLTPNGTGNIVLGTTTLDADQVLGAGQDNFVLTYDNGTGLASFETAAGGGGVTFGTDNQIPVMNAGGTDFEYTSNLQYATGLFQVTNTSSEQVRGLYDGNNYAEFDASSGVVQITARATGNLFTNLSQTTTNAGIDSDISSASGSAFWSVNGDNDTGTTPIYSMVASIGAAPFATRPLFRMTNFSTDVYEIQADGDFDFLNHNTIGISSIFLTEKAAADADVAGSGQLWVKDDAPNTLMFTDDAGTDFELSQTTTQTTTTTGAGGSASIDIPLNASSTYLLEISVVGGETDATPTMYASRTFEALYHRVGSGSAVEDGENAGTFIEVGGGSMGISLSPNGNNARVVLSGPDITSTNMSWRVTVKSTRVASN